MQYDVNQRALEVLGDYLFELETRDRKRGRPSYGSNRTLAAKPIEPKIEIPSVFDKAQEYAADLWEKDQLKAWKEQSRITEDGYLRVGTQPIRPYTLQDLMRIMPHLGVYDRLAALIDLDGVVKEGFMDEDAHENIKAVVKNIAADEVERVLATPEAKARIADIVVEHIGVVFGTLLGKINTKGSTLRPGGRRLRCGKCMTPGHRAPTCPETPEAAAEKKAAAIAAATA